MMRIMTSQEEREARRKKMQRNLIAKELRLNRKYLPKVEKRRDPKIRLNRDTFRNLDLEDIENDTDAN